MSEPLAWARAMAPESWPTVRLRDIATINGLNLPDSTDPDFMFDYIDISSVDSFGDVTRSEPIFFADAPSRARRIVRDGDILVSTVRTYLRAIAQVDRADGAIASTGFAVVTPSSPLVDGRFLYWLLRSGPFVEQVVAESVGVSYPAINATDLERMRIPLPPLDSQRAIARHLDDQDRRTRDLVSELERQVRLTAERRQATRDRLLIGGLDGAPTRTIQIPWNVEIPEHWTAQPMKYVAEEITVGIVVNPSHYYEDEGVPVLRGLNVRAGEVSSEALVYMSEASNLLHSKSMLREGDIVAVRTGNAGAAAVVPDWAVGGNAVDLLLVRPGARFLPKFLELQLNSDFVRQQVTYRSVGALQGHFNVGAMDSTTVVCPPIEEQAAMVAEIEALDVPLDAIDSELSGQLQLLAEHYQAMITAATTGHSESGLVA